MSPRLLAAFCVPVLSVALLAGCGSDDSDGSDGTADDPVSDTPSASSPASTDTAAAVPPLPACADVWRAEAVLPDPYEGCLEGDRAMPAASFECSSGQLIVTYDDTYWAVAGGKIQQAKGALLKDPNYKKQFTACRG